MIPSSYKEKLLSLGCGGFLVRHDETEDIVNRWKSFFAKKKGNEEDNTNKDEIDGVDTEGTTAKPKYPTLKVTAEQYTAWCQPWMNSLIIKLMGLQVPRHVFIDRIRRMWKPKDLMKVTLLSNDYYIISFSSREDREYAFQEGPWMIDDHYLLVQRWRPKFNPWKADNQRKIAAWIRIPDLPMEFYNVESLGIIGDMVGKTIKVDRLTSIYDKGGFACLHQVCFLCGRYRHKRPDYPLLAATSMRDYSSKDHIVHTTKISDETIDQILTTSNTLTVLNVHLGPQILVSRDFRKSNPSVDKRGSHRSNSVAEKKGLNNGSSRAGKRESGTSFNANNQSQIKEKDLIKMVH
ncbi:uncharacterized protein LOC114737629 [Neltuma alba]|uniref:uncharacterized protein LOC114737629 n=1 Tax=Neltuma alba TaxID=207710 RepID=UPI0010A2D310|nr:uncharacterized protein LOC114737629 [Prosopis alba]